MRPFNRVLFPAAAVAAAFVGASAQSEPSGAGLFRDLDPASTNLDDYRWDNRLVLLFGDSPAQPAFLTAKARLAAVAEGLKERDIVVLTETVPDAGGVLRTGLGIGGFGMVLVGKDGYVKINSDSFVAPGELFGTIDAMPMRQREMREG